MEKDTNEVKIARLEEKLDNIKETLDSLLQEVRGKWDHYDTKLTDLQVGYMGLSTKMVKAETTIENHSERITKIETKLSNNSANTSLIWKLVQYIGPGGLVAAVLAIFKYFG